VKNAEYLSLEINQAQRVEADCVTVMSGIVWLTQSGLLDDVLLFSGQSFSTLGSGKVVIQALSEDTKVCVRSKPSFSGIGKLIPALSNATSSIFRSGLQ